MCAKSSGFTLLEVVVALAILAAASTVILAHAGLLVNGQARALQRLRDSLALDSAIAMTEIEARRPGPLDTPLALGPVAVARGAQRLVRQPSAVPFRPERIWQKLRLSTPDGRRVTLWVRRQ